MNLGEAKELAGLLLLALYHVSAGNLNFAFLLPLLHPPAGTKEGRGKGPSLLNENATSFLTTSTSHLVARHATRRG